MAKHGIFVSQQESGVLTPATAKIGIPFVVGTAPFGEETTGTAGTPVLATSWAEAEEAIGYDDNWTSYTLCEFMYSHFKLFSQQPVIFLPLTKGEEDTDETMANKVASEFEKVELCMPMFGIVPDLLVAPGFSSNAVVSAVMAAKASAINGQFRAKALFDMDSASYTAAVSAKNDLSLSHEQLACWPMGTLGGRKFHLSTIVAGRIAATDTDNGGIPYESPSNKACHLDGLCLPDGTPVTLTKAQADILVDAGIVTALNFMGGYVVWGNYTAAYPSSTDVREYFIPVSRMFDYVGNTVIKTFWAKLDKPMNRRLIDTIVDSCNAWLDGLVGQGYLLGARVEVLADENPDVNLMSGIVKVHIYMTPVSPAQEIDFVQEYDASYVVTALT